MFIKFLLGMKTYYFECTVSFTDFNTRRGYLLYRGEYNDNVKV